MPPHIRLYTTPSCPYCSRAKALFTELGFAFEEIDLSRDPALRERLSEAHAWRTVPMIFVGERFLGGYDDVSRLHRQGRLRPLLEG